MPVLSIAEVREAIQELNMLSQSEYGLSLEDILLGDSNLAPSRLERITGIALKRPFAVRLARASNSDTAARFSWPWSAETPDSLKENSAQSHALLNELRSPGPWNRSNSEAAANEQSISWEQFKSDVEYERGLFKVLSLYVVDKLKGERRRSLKEYLESKESRRFESGLDLAVLVSDAAVVSPLAALLGVPAVAVGVALVGIQFGYRRFTDERSDAGDSRS